MAQSFPYCTLDDVKAELLGLDISDMAKTLETRITDNLIPAAQRWVDNYADTNFDKTRITEYYNGNGIDLLYLRHKPVREVHRVIMRIIPSVQWFEFKRWYYVNEFSGTGTRVGRPGGVAPKTTSDVPPYTFNENEDYGFEDEVTAGIETGTFELSDDRYAGADIFVDLKSGSLTIPPRILFQENQTYPFWNYTWIRGTQNIEVQYTYGYSDPAQPDELIDDPTNGSLPQEITDATAKIAAALVLRSKGLFTSMGAKSFSVDGVNMGFGNIMFEGHIQALEQDAKFILDKYKTPRV